MSKILTQSPALVPPFGIPPNNAIQKREIPLIGGIQKAEARRRKGLKLHHIFCDFAAWRDFYLLFLR